MNKDEVPPPTRDLIERATIRCLERPNEKYIRLITFVLV